MEEKDKTIFMVVHQGFAARYLLRTDILKTIAESGIRIVVLSPNGRDEDFRTAFETESVCTEKFENEKCEAYLNSSRLQKIMRTIRLYTLNGRYNTQTADNYFRAFKERLARTGRPRSWKVAILGVLIKILKRSKLLRKGFVAIEGLLFTPEFHKRLFQKYEPDMVVVTSLGNLDFDRHIMREARRHKAIVVSVILGMDNTSTKGYGGASPDYVVAWTENMKRELVELHDIDSNKIFVGGVAHFDYYFRDGSVWDKQTFCRRMGLDPQKKTILFGTKSPNTCPWSAEVVELVATAIRHEHFGFPCQMVVRLHPIHWRQKNGEFLFQEILEGYEQMREEYPFVFFNYPSFASKNINYDLSDDEFYVLKSLLTHSDVMINMFSTLSIEASIFQLPTINICFNGKQRDPNNPLQDLMFDFNESHNQRIIQTGGVKTAFSKEELLDYIRQYLKDPSLDHEGREKIRRTECEPFPGTAGAAIGQHVRRLMNQ